MNRDNIESWTYLLLEPVRRHALHPIQVALAPSRSVGEPAPGSNLIKCMTLTTFRVEYPLILCHMGAEHAYTGA